MSKNKDYYKKRQEKLAELHSDCNHHPNNLCYVCGLLAPYDSSRFISHSPNFQTAYECYFGFPVGHQTKNWVPHVVCSSCYCGLVNWHKGAQNSGLKFGLPMRWREPRDHATDCYFCWVDFRGLTEESRKRCRSFVQPWPSSVSKTVLHSPDLPVPISPNANCQVEDTEMLCDVDDDPTQSMSSEESSGDEFEPSPSKRSKHDCDCNCGHKFVTQPMLNDLAREMRSTPIEDAELMASRMREWGWFDNGTRVTKFRKRYRPYAAFFR